MCKLCALFGTQYTLDALKCVYMHVSESRHALMNVIFVLPVHVNLDFKDKQGNKHESPLFFSIFIQKKAAQVGLEPTTSCFQGSRSTN